MPTTVRTPRNPHYRAHTTELAPGVFAGHTRSEQRAWLQLKSGIKKTGTEGVRTVS
jgi:hypothetical protein